MIVVRLQNFTPITLLIWLISQCVAVPVWADESVLSDDELYDAEYCPEPLSIPTQDSVKPDAEFFDFLDPQQETISEYLRAFTTGMDHYFANVKQEKDHTGSYLNLTLDTTWREAGDIELKPRLKFRLRLPQTQKKLKLVIESDPDEKRTTRELETNSSSTTTDDTNKGVYTGIESDTISKRNWKIRPSLGIRIRSPIDYYVRLFINRNEDFDNWKLYLRETLYWFDSTGFGADTSMDWDLPLSETLLFRSSSFLRYTDERDQFDMSQSLNLIHQISENRNISYKAAVFADTEPAIYTTSYLLNIRYRQNLHKQYFFMEIQPSIIFERETDWEPQHELFLRFEIFYRG